MDLFLAIGGHAIWLPGVAALGVGVGLIAGMFGVGGGFLLIPLLHAVLGVPLSAAVGAGLCATIANALGAFLRYRQMGHAESRFDLMLLGGSLLGVDAGTRLLDALEQTGAVVIGGRAVPALSLVITGAYTALFAVIAWLLWTRNPAAEMATGGDVEPGPLTRLRVPPCADLPTANLRGVSGPVAGYIGLVNGVLAGLLGIGGGICLVPIMLYGYGFDVRKAAGTGIVIVLAASVVGTVQHARLGHVHLGLAATLMIGSALAAQVGASLTRSLSGRTLRRTLALVMMITLAALFLKVLG